jgi:hypothetical protein
MDTAGLASKGVQVWLWRYGFLGPGRVASQVVDEGPVPADDKLAEMME